MINLKIIVPSYSILYGKKHLRTALKAAAKMVIAKARSLIQPKGTISKPGQAPASRTGNLAKNFKTKMGKTSIVVMDNAKSAEGDAFYARFLETGAKGGGRAGANKRQKRGGQRNIVALSSKREMEPRPFLTTAVEVLSNDIQRMITASVKADLAGRLK